MKIIGLVGGSGAGKGMVSAFFKEYSFATIDADAVYHELISSPGSECLNALGCEFGESVISSDGTLDRKALARTVFASGNGEKRKKLNQIAHKFVLDEVRRRISALDGTDAPAVVFDAPLLFESGFDKECDIIVCVLAEKNARISRIVQRDGISEDMARARISSQLDDDFLISHSDFVIRNDSDVHTLEKEVERVAKIILNN